MWELFGESKTTSEIAAELGIRARLGLDDTWAYFTRVRSARAAAALARRWAR